MKRAIVILLTAVMAVNAWAASEIVDGVTWNYTVSNGKASVYKDSSSPAIPTLTKGALTIPATLGGCPVTSIGSAAFYGCSGLTSVTIPESVTSIGGYAFYNCSGLTSVTIPEGVTSIGSSAFSGCSGLTSVTIPEGVTSIAREAFSRCSGLTSVTIPSSVTSIGIYAFDGCSGLTSVTIPEGVTSIGEFAFEDCSGLTCVDITDLAKWCGISFYGYSANPLTYAQRLYLNGEEVNNLVIPPSVTSIGDYAFQCCRGLTSVTIPSSVTSIGEFAFNGCSGLTSVTIPEGVTSIGSFAFSSCRGLTSLTISSSVTSIGTYAFDGCSGLRSVEFLGAPPSGLSDSYLLSYGRAVFPREYGKDWLKLRGINSFTGYGQGEKPVVRIVSALIRENDPTVMDVVYKVVSAKPTVKVRVLAFQDGERSFAKVVRPTEFIEDTAKNIGDEIAANEEHKLSWRVSTDWKVDLANVKFEVLASDGDLLPLELTAIPKIGDHAAMEISWNAMTEQQVLDALLWLFADGDVGLTLSNGVLKNGTVQLVNKTSLSAANAIGYVYGKMGFSVLSGDELKYANEMTRFGLSPSGVRQYAWRAVEK